MLLLEHLRTQLTSLDLTQPCWIAYSGGLDSHVLLNSMAQLREQIPELSLRAIHVHHGLNTQADVWVEHCRKICAALSVDFHCEYINGSPPPGESVEAWARTARYSAFEKILASQATLLTAHTQDDQAETVLLQLLRGAGPKGLAAMPQRQTLSSGYLFRPLLDLTRQQLQEYAEQHSLSWIEDDSNTDQRFDRNFLRHRVIPVLRARWPAAAKNIARSARHCAEAADNLTELAQLDLSILDCTLALDARMNSHLCGNDSLQVQQLTLSSEIKPEFPETLPIKELRKLSASRQRNVLRYWLSALGCRLPNTTHLQQIQRDLINGRPDSRPQVSWGHWTIRRYRQNLIVNRRS